MYLCIDWFICLYSYLVVYSLIYIAAFSGVEAAALLEAPPDAGAAAGDLAADGRRARRRA